MNEHLIQLYLPRELDDEILFNLILITRAIFPIKIQEVEAEAIQTQKALIFIDPLDTIRVKPRWSEPRRKLS